MIILFFEDKKKNIKIKGSSFLYDLKTQTFQLLKK